MGLLLGLLVVALNVMQGDLQDFLKSKEVGIPLSQVAIAPFSQVVVSGNVDLLVKPGKETELFTSHPDAPYRQISERDGVLYLEADTLTSDSVVWKVELKTPHLSMIEAEGGAMIRLKFFKQDSLVVILRGGSSFYGMDNAITDLEFDASDGTNIKMISEPIM